MNAPDAAAEISARDAARAALIARARAVRIEDAIERLGVRLRGRVERTGPCPACGGHDRFSINTQKQAWNCRGAGGGRDALSLVAHLLDLDLRERGGDGLRKAVEALTGEAAPIEPRPSTPKPANLDEEEREARVRRSVAKIIRELIPIRGTPGERYLASIRKIDVDAIEDVIKRVDAIGWHERVYFNEPEYPERGDPPHPLHGQRLGCIVAIMTDPVTAKPTGAISRTYLDANGRKVLKAKTLGSPAGVIRLSLDEEVLAGLHIAEGLETALDMMARGFRPMWATGSTSIMSRLPVLDGVDRLRVFADHDMDKNGDDPGLRAATAVADRWREAGRKVRIYQRDALGDANDAFREVER